MKKPIKAGAAGSILKRNVFGHFLVLTVFFVLAIGNLHWRLGKEVADGTSRLLPKFAQLAILSIGQKTDPIAFAAFEEALADSLIQDPAVVDHVGLDVELINFQIWDKQGLKVYSSAKTVLDVVEFKNDSLHTVITTAGKEWRVYTVAEEKFGHRIQIGIRKVAAGESNTLVTVRDYVLIPMLIFLPLGGLITWFTTYRGLIPLRELALVIARRTPGDMSPLLPNKLYIETQPVIEEINSLLHQLEGTLRRERVFMADAAHELRTPLAVIQAQAHVLQTANTQEARLLAVNELNIGVSRAAGLIGKLLTSAKVSAQDFVPSFSQLDLTALLQDRIARFSILADLNHSTMELLAPPTCIALVDLDTFTSAVDNIIDNAIRYSPNGGRIKIELSKQPNGSIALSVTDQGMGVPEGLRTRVVERFFRVEGTEQQGSGLGLSIVQGVMTLHRGRVNLSTGLRGKGLCVELAFPSKH